MAPTTRQRLVYFYFDEDEKQITSTLGFLRSTVAQLIQQIGIVHEADEHEWFGPDGVTARESSQPATLQVLEHAVMAIVGSINRVVVMIDAVDECEEVKTLLSLVGRLRTRCPGMDVLMSSRPSITIRKVWSQLAEVHPDACHDLALSPDMNKDDITTYVTQTVDSMVSTGDLSLRNPGLQSEIVDTLQTKSDGM